MTFSFERWCRLLNVQVYCPTVQISHRRSHTRRPVTVSYPAFPGYIFVAMADIPALGQLWQFLRFRFLRMTPQDGQDYKNTYLEDSIITAMQSDERLRLADFETYCQWLARPRRNHGLKKEDVAIILTGALSGRRVKVIEVARNAVWVELNGQRWRCDPLHLGRPGVNSVSSEGTAALC